MLVSHGPWWWIRVFLPGAVVTIEEYNRTEPVADAEMAIERSMSTVCPVPVRRCSGVTRTAIGRSYRRESLRSVGDLDAGRTPLSAARRSQPGPAPGSFRGRARRPERGGDLDQARGPPPARLRRQQAAQPGIPGRGGPGGRRRHPRHVRPALVEPLPAHGRGRGANELLERIMGAHVQLTATGERAERRAAVETLVSSLRAAGRRPYVIDVGGSGVIGALGQVLAGLEVAGQAAAIGFAPDIVVLPTATGCTQAGLAVGLALAGLETAVTGVAVAHPAAEVRPAVASLAGELGRIAGLGAAWRPEIVVEEPRLLIDYGRRDPAAEEATGLLARTEGILVDPIYTAKALAWLVAQAREGRLTGRRVVFWHAGGTPGLFETLEPAG